jgi:hypothetical protein
MSPPPPPSPPPTLVRSRARAPSPTRPLSQKHTSPPPSRPKQTTNKQQSLCQRTSIPYSIYHVRTYADVRDVVRGVLRGADRPAAGLGGAPARTFLLLNCGGSRFVPDEVASPGPEDGPLGQPPEGLLDGVRFVVVDSHRPVHPAYNDDGDQNALLVLRADDPVRKEDVPRRNDNMDAFLLPETWDGESFWVFWGVCGARALLPPPFWFRATAAPLLYSS